jgi:hypothetical protein
MIPQISYNTSPQLSSQIMSRWRCLQSNAANTNTTNTHIRCEPDFLNTFCDLPCWIDPSTTLRIVIQNVQGIKPITTNDKLQSGIANMIALQAGITCLAKTNVEWWNYLSQQGNTRSTNIMSPPITLSAPRPKFIPLTTSVGLQLFLPLIDVLTTYTFEEKIQLVQEDGHTSLSWAKTKM